MKHMSLCAQRLAGVVLVFAFLGGGPLLAEEIHVDPRGGADTNSGAAEQPVRSLERAAAIVNAGSQPGATTVVLHPGVHVLTGQALFRNLRPYTTTDRLTIRASLLPDDPDWHPTKMPVVLSTAERGGPDLDNPRGNNIYGIQIEISHVTIAGIKFLGNPSPHSRYYPVRRNTNTLDDLLVTQCMFVGDRSSLPIHVAVIARGHGVVVENTIFYDCKNTVVFWAAEGGVSKRNAMRHCIVYGAYRTAVWVTDTADDFAFHNNVVANAAWFFMRRADNTTTYRLHDSVVLNAASFSGRGNAGGPLGETADAVRFIEKNITKSGQVQLVMGDVHSAELSAQAPKNWLHLAPGSTGSELGAGLFKK